MNFQLNISNLANKKAALVNLLLYMPKQAYHRSLCKPERDHLLPELIYQT